MIETKHDISLTPAETCPVPPVSPLRRLVFGLVLMTLAAGIFGGVFLLNSRKQILQQAEKTSQTLAEILQQTISAKIHKTDLTVRHVVDEVVHQTASGGIHPEQMGVFIERQFSLIPELDSLRITDANGTVILGSGNLPTLPVTVSDRDYFQFLRDNPDADFVISRPIIGKISKKMVITFARRITHKNGAFGGIAYGVIPIQQFKELFRDVPVGTHGSVSLRRDDFTLITRYSDDFEGKSEAATGSGRISEAWKNRLDRGLRVSGTYTSESVIDGVSRIYSYSRISPYPLYVNVGLALDDVLVPLFHQSLVVAGLFIFFLLTSSLLILLVNRNWQKTMSLFQYLSEIAELRSRYRFLAENSADVIWSMDPRRKIFTYVSPAVSSLRGFSPEEVMKQPVEASLTEESRLLVERVYAEKIEQIAAGDYSVLTAVAEVEQPCKGGGTVWTEVTTNYVVDESGELSEIIGISRDITQRRAAYFERERLLESLKDNQELFALFMKYSPVYCFIKEISGGESRVVQASENFVDMLGMAAADMIGKTMAELFSPEFAGKITEDDEYVVTSGEIVQLEENLNNKNYMTYKFPIKTAGGRKLLAGYTIDITHLKQTEEALRNIGDYLEKLINYANALIIVWDKDLVITRFNHAFENLSGYDAEEVIGKGLAILFPDHCGAGNTTEVILTSTGKILESIEIPVQCKDGSQRFVLWNSAHIYSAGGKNIISTIAQGQDITQRKKLEEVLQRQASVIKGVMESTDSAVFSVNREFEYTSFNSTHAAVMKKLYNSDIRIGALIFNFMTGEDAVVARDNIERALNGVSFVVEADSGNSERARILFEISHNPIRNDDGVIEGVAVFARDVSEIKKSEQEFREMQALMMQNDKLATIGQLAAGVAHEINNPMGFVGSNMATLTKYIEKYNRYIETVEDELCRDTAGELPVRIRDLRQSLKLDYIMRDILILMDECNEGIERVKRIVQDLRTFSRADSSAVGAADLNSCMDSTINIVINEIRYVAELKREYGTLPKIPCNAQQINQVFMNLLINAAHAIRSKTDEVGEIRVRSWCDKEWVFVSVSDNGCGIAPENCSKIFDAFFTTKDVGKGTGLGLSISSSIIRKHGGEIMVTSDIGVGTTFTVRLPMRPSAVSGEVRQ